MTDFRSFVHSGVKNVLNLCRGLPLGHRGKKIITTRDVIQFFSTMAKKKSSSFFFFIFLLVWTKSYIFFYVPQGPKNGKKWPFFCHAKKNPEKSKKNLQVYGGEFIWKYTELSFEYQNLGVVQSIEKNEYFPAKIKIRFFGYFYIQQWIKNVFEA